jgi:uncharacterized membrane protein/uncharacterized protein (UPF0548 family)
MPAPEWRFGRGWRTEELTRRLAALPELAATGATDPAGAHYHSQAIITREPPGPVLADGPFARARELVRRYEFSDPRIVTAHFDRDGPLAGRPMLLEIKVLGLRYLCPVRVGEVHDRPEAGKTSWGFRYDTLAGHLESGWEWFLLTKDHPSGEVSFRIEARWRPGQFPNWWSRLGFRWLARRYQRAWHRLAYLRLRARLQEITDVRGGEDVMRKPATMDLRELGRAVALGALAGLRSMVPLALVARQRASRPVARALTLAALGEWVADKTPLVPAHTQPLPLAGRMVAGALAAAGARRTAGRGAAWAGVAGALGALAGSFAGHRLRSAGARALGRDWPVALTEDALCLLASRALLARAAPC